MLGYSSGEVIPNTFGEGKGVIWLDNLNCTGSEYDLEVCPNLSWGMHNCQHADDVAIKCFKEAITTLSSTTSIPPTSSTDQNAQCPRGYYSLTGNQPCTKCPVNFYQNLVGSTKCLECSSSSFTNGTGATECLTCTNVNCTQCKSNEKVKIENHQITCVVKKCTYKRIESKKHLVYQTYIKDCGSQCPRGYYSLTGNQPCTKCPVNFYQNLVGSTKCLECSSSSFTNGTGATECLTCTNVNCTQCKSNEKVKIENHQITCVVKKCTYKRIESKSLTSPKKFNGLDEAECKFRCDVVVNFPVSQMAQVQLSASPAQM
ncbi:unnamed protein product [Acanthosepion pharaonis]|uniref:SRCR domain-containing protein n=1 Tax=Acanthosepion pharaonis TaxID=158019 RepID=A0A812DLM6_ACAPH|nr:unnamed protein product [Sepia pharaonis]